MSGRRRPLRTRLTGEKCLIRIQRRVDLGFQRRVPKNSRNNGTHNDSWFHDQSAGAVSRDNNTFDTGEELADTDAAAIVNVENYRLHFHTSNVILIGRICPMDDELGGGDAGRRTRPSPPAVPTTPTTSRRKWVCSSSHAGEGRPFSDNPPRLQSARDARCKQYGPEGN
jgi:hypothetical protein